MLCKHTRAHTHTHTLCHTYDLISILWVSCPIWSVIKVEYINKRLICLTDTSPTVSVLCLEVMLLQRLDEQSHKSVFKRIEAKHLGKLMH